MPRPMTVAVGCGLLDNQHTMPLSCRASKMRRDRVQRETGRESCSGSVDGFPFPISGLDTPRQDWQAEEKERQQKLERLLSAGGNLARTPKPRQKKMRAQVPPLWRVAGD